MDPADLLQKHFGFSTFRPGQQSVIDTLLAGRSALAVFPTGSGKSLCYQLPALAFEGVTLVVSPLIALMKDQIDFLTARGIAAARLDSSLGLDETRAIGDRLAAGSLKLLYVAPERFNNERFLAQIGRVRLSMLAIDEAHCISEWGHNFRPDYLKLADFARELGAERVLALTATATPSVVADIRKAFSITEGDAVVTGFYRPNLRLATTPVLSEKRDALLLDRLLKRPPGPSIVYVTLQKTAERIAALLSGAGLPAEAYHAGMESEARGVVQERWMASDRGIVVATIAFGMGIDKSDVRYVYHYNLPKSLESYSQEIGRAGRDQKPSTVEMLACPDDVPTLQNFAYGDTPTRESLTALLDDLLSRGQEFDVSLYSLSAAHDLRPLVLKTVLTYLELMGVARQGTPFYAGYEFRPVDGQNPAAIAEAFPGEPGKLIVDLFQAAKKGRLWYALNPDEAAEQLEQERRRITRALEVLAERDLIELRVADARQRYSRLRPNEDSKILADELMARFVTREQAEMDRLQRVLDLITRDGCQVNALTGYFGETRDAPCGHCGFCLTGRRAKLPPATPLPPLPTDLEGEVLALRAAHPEALMQPRQVARFLCGLSSPALTKAKLSRHARFASLEERPFTEVLAWCEAL
ncbi:MAG: RecQ family ATP-dependent DNA helicase [Cytophagales bacterium]|nr:RecQ family ATP-dependent DNA helicase [Armatimonadota bacterium]